MTEKCLFCRIVNRELPASIVSESPSWLGFRDIHPQAPQHIVLISKRHVANLSDTHPQDAPLLGELVAEAVRIARAQKIQDTGWRLVANSNPDGGQTVPHLHFHILGGRRMTWPPG